MSTIDSGWLVHQAAHEHLVPRALECARDFGASLESVDLASFIQHAADYLAKAPHLVTLLETADLGPLLRCCAHEHGASIGLLPANPKSKICRLFRIPSVWDEAMPLALRADEGVKLDLLLCNDEVVTWMVTLGDIPFVELRQMAREEGLFRQRVKALPASVRSLFRLQPKAITITTAKETQIKTAVIGALVIENDIESLTSHFASESSSALDGKLSAVFVAPSSIMEYFGFLAAVLSPKPRQPSAVSYVETASMTLESPTELDYYLDGQLRSGRFLKFDVMPQAVTVNVGEQFEKDHQREGEARDTMKIQSLPQGEERLKRLKHSLPLFSTAQEEDFKEVFVTLRDYARLSAPFTLLVVLSAMLATLGLFLDNAPVVIGAMILAPMMGPLVSIAMGILRNDGKLLLRALQVFVAGTVLTFMVAALTAVCLPYQQTTDEIRARLQPNLLDLGVAVIAGLAAAYVHARESVQRSLPGVAVAVALVPPACVIGIGIGWTDLEVIHGAGLLFVANLVGIVLAGMFAFLCLGFASLPRANRGLGFSLLLMALVSIPLYYAFTNTVVYHRIEKAISIQAYEINGKKIDLSDVSARWSKDKVRITAQLHSSQTIQADDIAGLRDVLAKQLGQPIVLDVALRLVQ